MCSIRMVLLAGPGSVVALAHLAGAQTPLYSLHGEGPGDAFGSAVDVAGDVNGDGFADVVVGAPLDDDFGSNSGSVRLVSGRDGSELATLYGSAVEDRFGAAVRGLGDVDRDGYDDFAVGAVGVNGGGPNAGMAASTRGKRCSRSRPGTATPRRIDSEAASPQRAGTRHHSTSW